MKKNVPYILAGLAVLNLIWLFGFNYRLPAFFTRADKKEAQEESVEALSGQEGEEVALQEGQEEGAGQAAEAPAEAEGGQEAEEGNPEDAGGETPEDTAEDTFPETDEPTCRSGEGNTPNIRSGPGTNYSILKTADFNEVMVVTGEPVNGWIPVRTKEGMEGYVASDMVDMQ